MGDSKSRYSDFSNHYVEVAVRQSDLEQARYNRSKEREKRHNENWIKQKVNINDIVRKFTPEDRTGHSNGVKYVFENEKYAIKADMASGYLRIYDKKKKIYLKIDGTPGNLEETHFKIKRRGEM